MTPLTVLVITRNEERNIEECLESVSWADEIIVVDAESKDKTVDLARKYTDKVYLEPWKGFAEAKVFGAGKAKHEWVFWLDADERVTPELSREIQAVLRSSPTMKGFTVARRAFFLGRWIRHSGWYPGRVPRLFQKEFASFSSVAVHEGLEVRGGVGELQNDLLHYTDPNLFHYFSKFNRYTSLASGDLLRDRRSFRVSDLLVRPPWAFVKMYFLRLGILDGIPGLILALLSSAYVFTKYAKLWEAWESENVIRVSQKAS